MAQYKYELYKAIPNRDQDSKGVSMRERKCKSNNISSSERSKQANLLYFQVGLIIRLIYFTYY